MCKHGAPVPSSAELVEALPDLEPICDLPSLSLPAEAEQLSGEAPETVEGLPLEAETPSQRLLLRNRNSSEIFGSPDDPCGPGDPPFTQPGGAAPAPRPAVLVSKTGFEIAVSDVTPSAAITELVDAAWKASSTPQPHGIVRVHMPFSTASVRRAAAMIQASAQLQPEAVSRKRKNQSPQYPSGVIPACPAPKRQLAVDEAARPVTLLTLPFQPSEFVHSATPRWSAGSAGAGGGTVGWHLNPGRSVCSLEDDIVESASTYASR